MKSQIKKYSMAALLSLLAMYIVMFAQVYMGMKNIGQEVSAEGFIKSIPPLFPLFFIGFILTLACVKIAETFLKNNFSVLLFSALAFTATDFLVAALRGAPVDAYFPYIWLVNFQPFVISYAFIRILDVREMRRKKA